MRSKDAHMSKKMATAFFSTGEPPRHLARSMPSVPKMGYSTNDTVALSDGEAPSLCTY